MLLSQVVEYDTAGVRIPLWAVPILLLALVAAKVYQSQRDKNR